MQVGETPMCMEEPLACVKSTDCTCVGGGRISVARCGGRGSRVMCHMCMHTALRCGACVCTRVQVCMVCWWSMCNTLCIQH